MILSLGVFRFAFDFAQCVLCELEGRANGVKGRGWNWIRPDFRFA